MVDVSVEMYSANEVFVCDLVRARAVGGCRKNRLVVQAREGGTLLGALLGGAGGCAPFGSGVEGASAKLREPLERETAARGAAQN